MTPAQMAVEVQIADDEDVRAAVARELKDAGVTLEDLLAQAQTSHFRDERCRLAWFTISPFVDC